MSNFATTQALTPAELLKRRPKSLKVRVQSITYQGEDINAYEVVPLDSDTLPSFEPGSHIDLYFRDGRVRQYSLCNDSRERNRYVFAVQRERNGRGGSEAIFKEVHVGRVLVISEPRNAFPLVEDAKKHLLVAGGIGITPILSMAKFLSRSGSDFELHYCTRSPEKTAFYDDLTTLANCSNLHVYHDGGNPEKGANLTDIVGDSVPGKHLYVCGPAGFLQAVREAASHWHNDHVHFESFSPPLTNFCSEHDNSHDQSIPIGFEVTLARTGETFTIPPDKTILEVLRSHGYDLPSSCEAGVCGTCKVRFLEGEPDHLDYILNDDEKREALLICCSRSKSRTLVLDL